VTSSSCGCRPPAPTSPSCARPRPGLASRLDFTIDDIEDLRIAVDEACAMLLAQAVPGADLECRFELTADAIDVAVSVLTLDGQEPSRDTFAWTVLTALAGQVSSSVDADLRVTLTLHKRKAEAEASSRDRAPQRGRRPGGPEGAPPSRAHRTRSPCPTWTPRHPRSTCPRSAPAPSAPPPTGPAPARCSSG
jgi:serine/threonine-protein kinase RsbW